MAQIMNFAIGKDVTAISLQGCTENADGTLNAGTIYNLLGRVSNVQISLPTSADMIKPLNTYSDHYEVTMYDSTVSITEILTQPANSNLLANFVMNYNVGYFYITRAGFAGSGGRTWSGYFRRGDYTPGYGGGGTSATLVLRQITDTNGNDMLTYT